MATNSRGETKSVSAVPSKHKPVGQVYGEHMAKRWFEEWDRIVDWMMTGKKPQPKSEPKLRKKN